MESATVMRCAPPRARRFVSRLLAAGTTWSAIAIAIATASGPSLASLGDPALGHRAEPVPSTAVPSTALPAPGPGEPPAASTLDPAALDPAARHRDADPAADTPQLSARDCREGADFIRNAALSRDAGMRAEAFLARLEEDLVVVMAMRPAVRWFVYSEREADLLRVAVASVFGRPSDPQRHASTFLAGCETLRASNAPAMRATAWPMP